MPRSSIENLAEEVYEWAQETFPNRTDVAMFLKMYSELGELAASDGEPDELADVFILLLDYAVRKNINITEAVRVKLAILRTREWKTSSLGVNQHV